MTETAKRTRSPRHAHHGRPTVKTPAGRPRPLEAVPPQPEKKQETPPPEAKAASAPSSPVTLHDVPLLDSPAWSSDDEMDNAEFNRKFRRETNERIRQDLKREQQLRQQAMRRKQKSEIPPEPAPKREAAASPPPLPLPPQPEAAAAPPAEEAPARKKRPLPQQPARKSSAGAAAATVAINRVPTRPEGTGPSPPKRRSIPSSTTPTTTTTTTTTTTKTNTNTTTAAPPAAESNTNGVNDLRRRAASLPVATHPKPPVNPTAHPETIEQPPADANGAFYDTYMMDYVLQAENWAVEDETRREPSKPKAPTDRRSAEGTAAAATVGEGRRTPNRRTGTAAVTPLQEKLQPQPPPRNHTPVKNAGTASPARTNSRRFSSPTRVSIISPTKESQLEAERAAGAQAEEGGTGVVRWPSLLTHTSNRHSGGSRSSGGSSPKKSGDKPDAAPLIQPPAAATTIAADDGVEKRTPTNKDLGASNASSRSSSASETLMGNFLQSRACLYSLFGSGLSKKMVQTALTRKNYTNNTSTQSNNANGAARNSTGSDANGKGTLTTAARKQSGLDTFFKDWYDPAGNTGVSRSRCSSAGSNPNNGNTNSAHAKAPTAMAASGASYSSSTVLDEDVLFGLREREPERAHADPGSRDASGRNFLISYTSSKNVNNSLTYFNEYELAGAGHSHTHRSAAGGDDKAVSEEDDEDDVVAGGAGGGGRKSHDVPYEDITTLRARRNSRPRSGGRHCAKPTEDEEDLTRGMPSVFLRSIDMPGGGKPNAKRSSAAAAARQRQEEDALERSSSDLYDIDDGEAATAVVAASSKAGHLPRKVSLLQSACLRQDYWTSLAITTLNSNHHPNGTAGSASAQLSRNEYSMLDPSSLTRTRQPAAEEDTNNFKTFRVQRGSAAAAAATPSTAATTTAQPPLPRPLSQPRGTGHGGGGGGGKASPSAPKDEEVRLMTNYDVEGLSVCATSEAQAAGRPSYYTQRATLDAQSLLRNIQQARQHHNSASNSSSSTRTGGPAATTAMTDYSLPTSPNAEGHAYPQVPRRGSAAQGPPQQPATSAGDTTAAGGGRYFSTKNHNGGNNYFAKNSLDINGSDVLCIGGERRLSEKAQ